MRKVHDFGPGELHHSQTITLCADDSGNYHLVKQSGVDVFDTPFFEEVSPDKQDGFCEVSWWALLNQLGKFVD